MWHPSLLLCISFALFALYPSSILFTHAQQQYTPTTLYRPQSAFTEGKALYVHGGRALALTDGNPPSNQTFLLDLSTPWSTDSPIFRQLASGFPSEGATSALYNNKHTWYLSSNQSIAIYDIQKNAWGQALRCNNSNPDFDMVAVADPINNSVYVVNGWQADSNMSNPINTMKYDEATGQISPAGNSVPMNGGFAAVWSTKRSSILVHGGFNKAKTVLQRALYEYIPITEQYTPISDKGDIPPPRYGHCMVEAYGGSKIVLFGGVTDLSPTSADIFIFDVATLTWTQGQTGDSTVGRVYAACAVTNDMFVAWGGATRLNNNFNVVKIPTVVYNLKTNGNGAWQKTYSPDSVVVAPSHVAAIVGGVIGGVFLIFFMVGVFVVYRRKQRKQATKKHSLSRSGGGEGVGSGFNSDDSITLEHEGRGKGTQCASYVVHAPVTNISPMAPTGYESSAYTAIGYTQPGIQPQPKVLNTVGAGPVVNGSMHCYTGEIYDPTTVAQEYPVIYQPPLLTPYGSTDSPQLQYQQATTAYQLPMPAHYDPSGGYAGYSPPVVASVVPSPLMLWTNSPTVTDASAAAATDASGGGSGGEPRVSVGGNGISYSKDEAAPRNPQGSE
ncbi:hypothetical protein BGZ97_005525 [Linnemannia gamsii]|jgi:hypothetical protein|uniref:Galactose oxidase n=1 Tax=Linnemannia gamsii TaxID=64522 RepID=A0A9P6QUE4_9FUNG|nr:hypothetical protein BGZ97_005525 [Linnemannia gamsii]